MDTNSVLDEPLGGGGAAGGGAAGGMALPPSQWPLSQAVIKRPLISNINWSQFRAYSLLSPSHQINCLEKNLSVIMLWFVMKFPLLSVVPI